MAINVNVANVQAGQLSGYANQLVSAKNQLSSYKSSISTYWQGQEVSYIVCGINQTIAQIDRVIKQLNNLSSDIKSTAATIKREDDAARARALKQQRIKAAQVNYNRAVDECDNLYKERNQLEKILMKNRSLSNREFYQNSLDEIMKKIKDAERKRNDCYNALNAVRR